MVVAFHAGLPVPGGFVGVDVFFVISGFVITAMLSREWAATGRVRLGRFYLRRFKRLTPALAVTVGVVMVGAALLQAPFGDQQTTAKTGIGALLLVANVVIARTTGGYFDAPAEANPLLHTWSLSVEEQFYVVFPVMVLATWVLGRRLRRPRMVATVIVGLVGAVSFAVAVVGSLGREVPLAPAPLLGFYGPATRAWEFALGALLAMGGARSAAVSRRFSMPLAVAGGVMLIASTRLITEATPFPGPWALLPVIGTVLVIAGGSRDTLIPRFLASGPMVAIGDRSYSIYLWHWPFIVLGHRLWPDVSFVPVIAAAVSFGPAYVSYRWVEQPIRAMPHRGGWFFVRLVAVVLVPPLALAGSLGLASRNGFWSATVQSYQAAIQPAHAGAEAGCTQQAWQHPSRCTWNAEAGGTPVYLVGDSNADHFSEGLIAASESTGRPVVGLSEDGCSYLSVSLDLGDAARNDVCGRYAADTEAHLKTAEPGLVVIANSNVWFGNSRPEAIGPLGEPPERTPEGKLAALSSGLVQSVGSLREVGHDVLIVQAVPHWGDHSGALDWGACSVVDIVTVGCVATMPMADVTARQGAVADVVEAAADQSGARTLDLSEQVCPGGTCSSVAPDGLVRYRDGTHITVPQSQALAGSFATAMAGVGDERASR